MSLRVDCSRFIGGSAVVALALATACGSDGGTSANNNHKPAPDGGNGTGDTPGSGAVGTDTGGSGTGATGSGGTSAAGRGNRGGRGGMGVAGSTTGSGGASGVGVGGAAGMTVDVPLPPTAGTFIDNFTWSGVHSAVINGGKGTGVWLNADNWDITGDTHAIGIMGEWSNTPAKNPGGNTTSTNSGHYAYIQKAADGCDASATGPCTGATDDTVLVAGGDKSPGIAVFSLDEQDIVGARLRTPIVISESAPGIISFRATRMVTLGHWWEVALTPADRVIGAENTVVESQGEQDGLGDPSAKPNAPGKGAGPGHDPQEESFNVVATSVMDFACETNTAIEGSVLRLAVKSLIKGANNGGYQTATGVRYNAWNPKNLFSGQFHGTYAKDFIRPGLDGTKPLPAEYLTSRGEEDPIKVAAANLADADNLYLWQFEFRPSGVDVKVDLNDGKGLILAEHFNLGVPWPVVYAHFMAVEYQADHHPQIESGCPFLPNPYTKRDIKIRSLSIGPVQYAHTSIFPPDGAPTDANGNVMLCNNGQSCGVWMKYDMRDTRNFGTPDTIDGMMYKKANTKKFSFANDYAHGSTKHYGSGTVEKSFDLYVPISDDLKAAKATNFVYNVLGSKGVTTLSVNGHMVGNLQSADSVVGAFVKNDVNAKDQGCNDYTCMSVRRSISIDPALFQMDAENGVAHIQIAFDQTMLGVGTFIDRMQLEMMH